MSDQMPPPEPEHTVSFPTSEVSPEVGSEAGSEVGSESGATRGRRGLVLLLVATVIALVLGGTAFAAYQFLNGGGPRPEDALPSVTVAEVSVDLDPHAGQKIEAIKTLEKFPALRKRLGISSEDDLRRYIVDKGLGKLCPGLDYTRDVKPWIGERAALAAVDLGGKQPAPALVLAISDSAKATSGFAKLAACGKDSGHSAAAGIGYAVGKDFLIASDTTAHAQAILAAGQSASLADDPTYQKWSGERGDAGVLNFYVAPSAGRFVGNALDGLIGDLPGVAGQLSAQLSGGSGPDPLGSVKKALNGFKGAAGALRFADGGMELVLASGAGGQHAGGAIGPAVEHLPADTALVAAVSIPDGFAKRLVDRVKSQGPSGQSFLNEAETRTGLSLPGDLQSLLGNAITLSVGGSSPRSRADLDDPEKVPVGLVIHASPDQPLGVIGKLEDHLGFKLSDVPIVTQKGPDSLVLSPSSAYAKELTTGGSLGDTALFKSAIPDPDHAQTILFLALDDAWRTSIANLAGDSLTAQQKADLVDNLKPFGALGMSSTVDGGVALFELRIATR